ncbi:unnamed protein product [Strongylus vulgaris]|uniref:PHD-type domain-containing protein n=1 Tax=Strongylus vulgaris TaxID=40348 RepID=A0A3P7I8A4_STRVU|nr:unnamed protein product [Strongylus vulgaris]
MAMDTLAVIRRGDVKTMMITAVDTQPIFIIFYFELSALLWASESVNFFAEKAFNQSAARSWPHCAVCQYFQPLHMSSFSREIPHKSARLAFGLCFAKDERRLPAVDLPEDVLITCSNCGVTVHPSCYGGPSNSAGTGEKSSNPICPLQAFIDDWRCLRCRDHDDIAIRGRSCHLCELRGGALVPCRAGADISAFVHTICAIFNRASANAVPCSKYLPRDYVLAMGDEYESSRYQCDLCGISREGLIRCSACDEDDDPILAHVTCARQAGFLFERRTYPQITAMVCDRHQVCEIGPLMDIDLGDTVIAWMDGGALVRQGTVDRLVLRTQLTVDFEDGSVSDNALPSDIVLCSCIRRKKCSDGQHQPGSRVKVRWNDGELYDAYYRCTLKAVEYTVVFRDGTSARLPRSDIYGAADAVPQEVRRRLRKFEGANSASLCFT